MDFIRKLQFFADSEANRRMIGLDIGCKKRKLFPYAIGVDIAPLCRAGDPPLADGADLDGIKPPEMVRFIHDICCDARCLPMFADGSLDYILSNHSLEHISEDAVAVLTEWGRVLKPGGLLFVAVPNGRAGPHNFKAIRLAKRYKTLADAPRFEARDVHRCSFTPESLHAAVLAAGFEHPVIAESDETEIEIVTYKAVTQ